jgi:hypothetical protein
MSFKITAESDLWESRGTFTLALEAGWDFQTTASNNNFYISEYIIYVAWSIDFLEYI